MIETQQMPFHVTQGGVSWLCYLLSQLQPTAEKICAIKEAPPRTNLHQLKSFLGLINFYAKFLPNLSTTLAPLYSLLQKAQPWLWESQHQRAFEVAKSQLSSSSL